MKQYDSLIQIARREDVKNTDRIIPAIGSFNFVDCCKNLDEKSDTNLEFNKNYKVHLP